MANQLPIIQNLDQFRRQLNTILAGLLQPASSITASGASLSVGNRYPFGTAGGPLSATLPPLSSVQDGQWLDWLDADYSAGTNNITFNASGSDQIAVRSAMQSSFVAGLNGAFGSFTKRNGAWRVVASAF